MTAHEPQRQNRLFPLGHCPQPGRVCTVECNTLLCEEREPASACRATHELGLRPITTPAYGPERNGLAEAFVGTFKRDDLGAAELRDAEIVLTHLAGWFDEYTSQAPHSALGMRSPRIYDVLFGALVLIQKRLITQGRKQPRWALRQSRPVRDLHLCCSVGPRPFYESEPYVPPSLTRTQLGPNHASLSGLIRKRRLGRRAESHGS